MKIQHILLILVITAVAYFPSLFNDFVGDDHLLLVKNSFYKSWDNFPRLFKPGYSFEWDKAMIQGSHDVGSGSVSYRPVDNATYFVDYAIWGLNPFGFHLTNLLLHLGNVVLVYVLLVTLGVASSISVFAALLFGLHPIQVEAVCNIGYRADSLACFFILLSFISWIKFSIVQQPRKYFFYFSIFSYACGVFSKESAIFLPVVIIFYEYFINKKRGMGTLFNGYILAYWLVTIFYLYLYYAVFPNTALPTNTLLGDNVFEHLFGMEKILSDYLIAFVTPFSINLIPAIYLPQVEMTFREILLPSVVLMGFVFVSIFLVRRSRISIFFISWFLLFYVPVSNIIPLANPIAYRFMYLPSIGILTGLAILIHELLITNRLAKFFKASLLVLLGTLTFLLCPLWKNNYTIGLMWVDHYPKAWRGYEILGMMHYEKGDWGRAKGYFLDSIERGGLYHDIRMEYFLAVCYFHEKNLKESRRYLEHVLEILPQYVEAKVLLEKISAIQAQQ